jgi:hypothetical protein
MNRIQFMLGQPGFFRRLLLMLAEHAQGAPLSGKGSCGTTTANYAPAGFTHISHASGRADRLADSMEWAKQFALAIAAEPVHA